MTKAGPSTTATMKKISRLCRFGEVRVTITGLGDFYAYAFPDPHRAHDLAVMLIRQKAETEGPTSVTAETVQAEIDRQRTVAVFVTKGDTAEAALEALLRRVQDDLASGSPHPAIAKTVA